LTEGLADERQEHFIVIALDCRNRVLGRKTIGIGSLASCPVEAREVFNFLISVSAAKAVVVHNHPSGDPEPSDEDRLLTKRLKSAGELVGIPIVDHVIVARDGYFSFSASESTVILQKEEREAA
jgi:DNA repair protein RadC